MLPASVAVCIATYRRPTMLSRLLQSLGDLETPSNVCSLRRIIVVDNDASESARPVFERFARGYPGAVHYECISERNISIARNSGVAVALTCGADFIAFIDDDCIASPGWVMEMVRVAEEFSADVVWGRLRYEFEENSAAWAADGNFFDSPPRITGRVMSWAESNNALVRATILQGIAGPFDVAFGIAGGGDSLMFRRAHARGAKIVWAENAIVTETIPSSRTSAAWLIQRAYRTGNCGVFVLRALAPARMWLPDRLGKAIGHIGIGVLLFIPALVQGRGAMVHSARRVAVGMGILTALMGHRYSEYRRLHGS